MVSLPAVAVQWPASGKDPGVALERRQRRARQGQSGDGGVRARAGAAAAAEIEAAVEGWPSGGRKRATRNGRVLAILGLATLGPATALSTAALHAFSAGHDAPASAVLPPRPRTHKGCASRHRTHVGILSKMAASDGGFFCTCGDGVESGRSSAGGGGGGTADGRGQRAEPADNDATTWELGGICVEHSPAGCRGNRQGSTDEGCG
uniref:Uncharacterized protein n=2 Tax=Oryza sativa subsp. japonica TaxID=39947 RepID=Q8SBA2_ORYSJ|nr:hypothetical protein [Oryza sativa Japonica Group]AAP55006.1 hypothetical protein LOC_Os10g41090 [Oryza sativa Japonica Group]